MVQFQVSQSLTTAATVSGAIIWQGRARNCERAKSPGDRRAADRGPRSPAGGCPSPARNRPMSLEAQAVPIVDCGLCSAFALMDW